MAQSLSNGYCNLPLGQGRCPHANACLNCANFKTERSHLPQHEKQLVITKKILDVAEKNNWPKQIEVNNAVKVNLEKIICTLNGSKDVSR